MAKRLKSIFSNEDKCLLTHREYGIERHHVFEGRQGFKKKSEKYGFICPLHRSVHVNGAFCDYDKWTELDHWLKRKCQEWYIEVAHIGSRDDWYREFGKFYDDRADEDIWLNGKWEWDLRKEK